MSLKDPPGAFVGSAPKRSSAKNFLQKKQFFYVNSSKLMYMNSRFPARSMVMVGVYCVMAIPVAAWAYNTDKNGTRRR